MEIDVGSESKRTADEPSEQSSENAAEEAHHPGFDEKQLLDVAVGGAKRFQHTDFSAAFEDGHHERVDDAKRGHGERQAAEDAEKKVEHGKENTQTLGCVEQRKCAEAEIFEFGFRCFHERRAFYADGEAGVGGFVARRIAKNVA